MSQSKCSIDGCERSVSARGWCNTHYARWRRNGAPELQPKLTTEERFWKYVFKDDEPDGCWLWIGGQNGYGYGAFKPEGRKLVGAHRYAYELLVGPIPKDYVIDHLCCNPSCCNPRHLEAVTELENIRRGSLMSSRNRRKTKCKYGHWLIGNNVIMRPGGGRKCRVCSRIAEARDIANIKKPDIPLPSERHATRPKNPCRACEEREVAIAKHGMCQRCWVSLRLERARDVAATIPLLEQLLFELEEGQETAEAVAA